MVYTLVGTPGLFNSNLINFMIQKWNFGIVMWIIHLIVMSTVHCTAFLVASAVSFFIVSGLKVCFGQNRIIFFSGKTSIIRNLQLIVSFIGNLRNIHSHNDITEE